MNKGLAIIGVAEVPTRRDPERTRWDILLDVCMGAVRDAGIGKNDIGAVISVNPMAQAQMSLDMALGKIPEQLGMSGCRDICVTNSGGTSTTNALRLAEWFIDGGHADFVLVPHTTVQSDIPVQDLINFFAIVFAQELIPQQTLAKWLGFQIKTSIICFRKAKPFSRPLVFWLFFLWGTFGLQQQPWAFLHLKTLQLS